MMFYLGSIVVSFAFNILTVSKVVKDISNKGYKFKNQNKKQYLRVFPLLQLSLFDILPVVNLITSTLLMFNSCKLSKICIKNGVKYNLLTKKVNIETVKEIEIDKCITKEEKIENKEMVRESKLEILREEYRKLTEEQVVENDNQKKMRIGKKRR